MTPKPSDRLVSMVQKALFDYPMIHAGDHVLIGVSGGKDSMALLHALSLLRRRHPVPYSLSAASLGIGFESHGYEAVAELCNRLDVPHIVADAGLERIASFRKVQMPAGSGDRISCSLCARVRRAALARIAAEIGCSKVALGHNRDDAVETFFLRMTRESRLGCFSPVTRLARAGIDQIRPLLYVPGPLAAQYCTENGLALLPSECAMAGKTARSVAAAQLEFLSREIPDIHSRLFHALLRDGRDGWQIR